MNTAESIKNVVLLDRQIKLQSRVKIQKSIEKAVDQENYECQTIRVEKDGNVEIE